MHSTIDLGVGVRMRRDIALILDLTKGCEAAVTNPRVRFVSPNGNYVRPRRCQGIRQSDSNDPEALGDWASLSLLWAGI